jgi:hypothetical protein
MGESSSAFNQIQIHYRDTEFTEANFFRFNGKLRRCQLQFAEGFFHFLAMLRITR